MKTYSIGILGLGVKGRAMVDELNAVNSLKVIAAFDPAKTDDTLKSILKDSAEAVCNDPAVDIVYVATPPKFHEAGVALALAAGKAILCEKPLADSVPTARKIADAVKKAGFKSGVNFYLATSEAGLAMNSAVTSGSLGDIKSIDFTVRFKSWPRAWQSAAGSWLSSPNEGGGFTREVVSHFVFLADKICGPGKIRARSVIVERGHDGLETSVKAVVDHGGVPMSIDAKLDMEMAAGESNRFTVTGTKGSAAIVDWVKSEGLEDWKGGNGTGWALIELMEGGKSELPGMDAAARVVEIVEGLLA
jgi:predicted dehydrogenase